MTTKILSTYAATGYTLSSAYSGLDITASGGVGGYGVRSDHFATISNAGTIRASTLPPSVGLSNGGVVINRAGGYIGGAEGITAHGPVAISNYGTISVGGYVVFAYDGGSVVNGSYAAESATLAGFDIIIDGSAGTVTNFGAIDAAVYLKRGGTVTNGGVGDTTALIMGARSFRGYAGVVFANVAGVVTNFGTIEAPGAGSYGVRLLHGGQVTNGTATDRGAFIEGYTGVLLFGAAGTVTNWGTVLGVGPSGQRGVYLEAGGVVTNGGLGDTTALIEGASGVVTNGVLATNFGVIRGTDAVHGDYGVLMFGAAGGSLANGSAIDHVAFIEGYTGASLTGAAGTVANWGTIEGDGLSGEEGLYLAAGGVVTNGGAGDTAALIEGASGVVAYAGATLANYGAIVGATAYGVQMTAGGAVTNGTAIDHGALVRGYTGVSVENAVATVTNWGSIEAVGVTSGGQGVYLGAGGQVTNGGAGDTAALVSGASGVVAYAAMTLANFGEIDGATGFAVEMTGGLVTNGGAGAHSALIEGYRGVVATGVATVKNFGTVRATGFANGAYSDGVALLAGGDVVNGSRHNGNALISGYTGLRLGGPGTVANFGTIFGTGENVGYGAAIYGGVDLVNGDAIHGAALIDGYYGLTAYGLANTVTNFGTISGASGTALRFNGAFDVLVVEAGCAFGGAVIGRGGTLDLATGVGKLSGLAGGNVTVSGSMAATLFQDFLTLRIGAAAGFATSGAVTLLAGQSVIDDGFLTLGSTKAGVANAGTIAAEGGTLTVKGAVTGSGSASIGGGLLDFTAGFNEAVTFTGAAGTLELAQSQTYTAAISGFSKTGGTALDLVDIAFTGAGEATYSGTRKKGVLTVTDGTHTAQIHLVGDYLSATFIASSDGHGGTTVVDPRATAAVAPIHRLIAAMGGLEAKGGPAGLAPYGEVARHGARILARPAA